MDALGCMQLSGSNSSESSVKFTSQSNYPAHASLLCDLGSFYMWWVNCDTTQSERITAPFPSGVTINHLYYVGSNPPRVVNDNTSTLRTNIEPTELTTSNRISLQYSNGIMSRQVMLRRLSGGIMCSVTTNGALVSLQFIIT